MILPNTMITVLDVDNGKMKSLQIQNVIPTFHIDSTFTNDHNKDGFELLIRTTKPPKGLMLKDLNGWTSLLSITKFNIPNDSRYFIINDEIIVSEDEMLVIYNQNITRKGFHGSTLFEYRMEKVSSIKSSIMLRKSMNEFQMVNVKELKHWDSSGYVIRTNSGFYNAGISDLRMSSEKIKFGKSFN